MASTVPRQAFRISRVVSRQCKASGLRQCTRSFSTTVTRRNETPESPAASPSQDQPRWAYTPEGMKAPFSINVVKDPKRQIWKVNEDPEKLERMYERLLGKDVAQLLPDELKWLAVTHKSFDGGRRGFNTRLAFFGRQIIALEATRSILASPATADAKLEDPYGREPFEHPALANVDKLAVHQPQDLVSKEKLSQLAADVGLHSVLRWKPRLPENLQSSGLTVVLTTTMFAIVGAVSLQTGAEVASRVVRERILKRISA
ncbi:uncharacterized protein E0L32_005967 [Thyridium curvatum]|uniref:RNase III domain-containing protein n=1 Tax=Thyridium curvatum TaxID=1093900 RepID=A0A507B351_9PEZI|nr:uncharacterized protein E0L32_005967 [Thyridium curvatum]TPX13496.1 hypothetical protein E0L32_005967 [Thyridium curvatum]